MRIESQEFGTAWDVTLHNVLKFGEERSPRGMRTKEILGAQIVVRNANYNVLVCQERDLNYRFMVAEWAWITAGRNDVEFIAKYNKAIAQFSDDGQIFNGAYGPKLAGQWDYVIESLKKPDSRQAVATIWQPAPPPSKDIPCTVAFQFLLRDRLHMIATMRSSDAWLGLPYDFFNFSQIANGIAGELGVELGSLTMQLGSLHLYEQHWDGAEHIVEEGSVQTLRSPQLPNMPRPWLVDKQAWALTHSILGPYDYYAKVLHQDKNKAEALETLRRAQTFNR